MGESIYFSPSPIKLLFPPTRIDIFSITEYMFFLSEPITSRSTDLTDNMKHSRLIDLIYD